MKRAVRWLLLANLGGVCVSAVVSGPLLIATNGLGMPSSWLENSFSSFLIPGLILTFIVGGTHLLAFLLILRRHPLAIKAAAVAGFGLLIWIFTQMYLIHQSSFLQVVYFSSGILTLALAISLDH